ncbi:hypothetical protein L798_01483 [Zootermopsis nevadensis]|uniref:Uncharacterized protein n=1 Tax=Zootermopsis nevadensis TaxID=136037 RepID=A0A067QIT8_ZOONE|nr:hypothetical protein L798_01483 [Zootermopsis nevadensis]
MKLVVNQLDKQQQTVSTIIAETLQCGLDSQGNGYRSSQADPLCLLPRVEECVPNICGVVQPEHYADGDLSQLLESG